MSDRRGFLARLVSLGVAPALFPARGRAESGAIARGRATTGVEDRAYWVGVITRLATPVLTSLAAGELHRRMPVEVAPTGKPDRREYTHLEAVGRLLTGMAPWLELGDDGTPEGRERGRFAELARRGIAAATDPRSPDFMNFTRGGQPVVDAAFLAHAILRAPTALWAKLDDATKRHVAAALASTRVIRPAFSNWLMFSAIIEAALSTMGERWDRMRVDYALREHEQWYKGDGVYGDGPPFHWDYYNSFVIHPMLLDVLIVVGDEAPEWRALAATEPARATRYAAILERLISPEGTYPPIGRSLAYRFGAFQLLGQVALRHELPAGVAPAQVRCALTAVIRRMIEAPGTFDREGWLTIGFCGHQPDVGEGYISTGSLYLCAAGLVPLGLPATDEFWSGAAREWTGKRIWSGEAVGTDHAM